MPIPLLNRKKSALFLKELQKAHRYESHSFLQQEIATRLESRLDYIRITPQVLLDLGSATGFTSKLLKRRYPQAKLIACDPRENLLHLQSPRKTWFSLKREMNPFLLCTEAAPLSLCDNSADIVFSNLLLPWHENVEKVFAEIFRVLKPGGLLLFSTFGPDTFKELKQISTEFYSDQIQINSFKDMHDIGDMLLRQRFVDPVVDMEMLSLEYEDFKKMTADLRFQNTLRRSPSKMNKNLYSQFLKNYQDLFGDENLILNYEIIYGHAWMSMDKERKNTSNEVLISLDQIIKKAISSS